MSARTFARILAATALTVACTAWAQVPPYGPTITLEQAKKAMAAAEAEARKNSWRVAIAITDAAGNLVMFQKLDDTQTASVQIAQDKAASSAMYRRPTKAFQDELQRGGDGLRVMTFPRASHADGGVPIVADGKIIGGIGASGVLGNQDAQVASAGANALK
jgi:glc operon protein GlcG